MRQTILLADDSPTIQRLVAQTFADSNFDVVSVSNGEAAIRRLEEARPSVVLADIYMPGRSGYEVCAYVRAHAVLGATPVILLVGAFDAFDEETATRTGATASITKPFEPRALIELVKSVIVTAGEGKEAAAAAAAPAIQPRELPPPALKAVPSEKPVPVPKEKTPVAPPSEDDILGLAALFHEQAPRPTPELTEADVDRIAERVMKKVSAQAVESVAWDVVPEIAEKVLRESIKRTE